MFWCRQMQRNRIGTCKTETSSLRDVNNNILFLVGLEVLAPVVMRNYIFCDITPCWTSKVNRRFGRQYRLHNRDPRKKPNKKPTT